jgi:Polysaccharide lyase
VAAFATGTLDPSERVGSLRHPAVRDRQLAEHRIGIARNRAVAPPGEAGGPAPPDLVALTPADLAETTSVLPATAAPPEPQALPSSPGPEPEPPAAPEAPAPPVVSPPEPVPPPVEPPPEPEPPQPSGEVLFAASFDDGFAGWYVQSLPGRVSITGASSGETAARFEVRQGDVEPDTGSQRSELSGPTFDEGDDLYIRDEIRIPSANAYTTPWEIVQQLHEVDWNGSPGMAVFLESAPSLRIGAGDGSPVFWRSGQLQQDRWYDLVYRVYLSQDPGAGFVEVWLDGSQQNLVNGQTRIYGQTIQAAQTYLKAGIYRSRSSTGTSIVEHGSIVVGTSLAAVEGS